MSKKVKQHTFCISSEERNNFIQRERERERERARNTYTSTQKARTKYAHQNDPNVWSFVNVIYVYAQYNSAHDHPLLLPKSTSSFTTYTDVGLADENIKSNLQKEENECVQPNEEKKKKKKKRPF
jgi:hypothetical protein